MGISHFVVTTIRLYMGFDNIMTSLNGEIIKYVSPDENIQHIRVNRSVHINW